MGYEYGIGMDPTTLEDMELTTDGLFRELAQEINKINKANGWNVTQPKDWDDTEYKIPAILALIHSEVSEALEAYRKDDVTNFKEELADVMIRVLDCAGGLGLDLGKAIHEKLEKNRHREYRHGGKKV